MELVDIIVVVDATVSIPSSPLRNVDSQLV
jgi:predicted nuclease with RNAse H fold